MIYDFVQTRYDPDLCANVINHISFGNRTGFQVRTQDFEYHRHTFMLPPNPNGDIYTFNGTADLLFHLSFDWFKLFVLCPEQPWICDAYEIDLREVVFN